MSVGKSLLWFGAGAGLMYLFDPQCGPRRRDAIREWLSSRNRPATGDNLRAGSLTLEERVRAVAWRSVSNPQNVWASARGGVVLLSGRVSRPEEDGLLKAVFAVQGVTEIINQLHSHDELGDLPPVQAMRLRVNVR